MLALRRVSNGAQDPRAGVHCRPCDHRRVRRASARLGISDNHIARAMVTPMPSETAVRDVIRRIDDAWRSKRFEGLAACFHHDAVIVGPGYVEFARGREKCAESYREFALNTDVISYAERAHVLRVWGNVAVYTFAWEMTYRRGDQSGLESGTDQLVLAIHEGAWCVVFRYIHFAPGQSSAP